MEQPEPTIRSDAPSYESNESIAPTYRTYESNAPTYRSNEVNERNRQEQIPDAIKKLWSEYGKEDLGFKCAHEVIELSEKLEKVENAKEMFGKHVKRIYAQELCSSCQRRGCDPDYDSFYEGWEEHEIDFSDFLECQGHFEDILQICPNLEEFTFSGYLYNDVLKSYLSSDINLPKLKKGAHKARDRRLLKPYRGVGYLQFVQREQPKSKHEDILIDILKETWETVNLDCFCAVSELYDFFQKAPNVEELYGQYIKTFELAFCCLAHDFGMLSEEREENYKTRFNDLLYHPIPDRKKGHPQLEYIFQFCPNIENIYFEGRNYNDQCKSHFPNINFSKMAN